MDIFCVQKYLHCYPASRGHIFFVWAVVRKVASADSHSNLSKNVNE